MTKYCKNCNKLNENILLKYCRSCYPTYWKKLVKTQINPISDKKKERLKETWWEKEKFRKILIDRQKNWYLTCSICWKSFLIENAWPTSFAHILAKWQYKAYRLFDNNIALVCNDININSCHTKLDLVIKKIQKEIWYKQLEEMIASWKEINNLIDNYK